VGADLQIANLAGDDLDASLLTVADVIAVDVDLVEVDALHEDADTRVVIDVTVADIDVAGAVGQVNAVAAPANQQRLQGRLHDAVDAAAVRLGVPADDLEVAHRRHALVLPDRLLKIARMGRSAMAAGQVQRRPWPGHDEPGHAALSRDRDAPVQFKW